MQRNQTGVTLQMDAGVLQLQVCGERTIHVLYAPTGDLPKVPGGFAVRKQPAPGAFDVTDAGETVALTAAQCSVQVDKKTGALTFLGHDGKPYLRETPDGGKVLTPATVAGIQTNTVEQTFVLDPTEGLYGLGQHPTGVMDYVGTTVHLEQKNMDTAVPVLVSSKGYGVFWNNPAITDVTISPSSQANPTVEWKSESGNKIDYYVFYGPDLDQVIADYRELTGTVPMFGRWAWGFWQCKEHYATQQELLDVAARYRQMKVPIDGIIQDWFYWDPHPWGSHQFDAKRYPDPAALTKTLHAEDIHIIISVWAKFAPGSENVEALQQAGDLLGSADPDAQKKVQFYDPFKPAARELYWDQMKRELFVDGFDGWWLDASEPELNSNWGEFRDYKTAAGPAAAVYNAYRKINGSGDSPSLELFAGFDASPKSLSCALLKDALLAKLNALPQGQLIFLKLTLPEQDDFYIEFVKHPAVVRVLALSGGYSRREGDERLRKNHGIIASFSRALLEGLTAQQSDAEFDSLLDAAVQSIFEASEVKIP